MGFAEVRRATGLALLMLLSTALPFADFSIYNPPESLDEQLPSSKVVSGTSEIGDWISAMKIGSSGFDDVREIVSDSQGNVYLHGTFSNTISIGSTNLTSAGNRDMFVAKFSSDGTLIWALRGGGNGSDQGYGGLVLDSNGSVIVTGIFSASGASFGTTSLSAAGSASENLYVAKISSGGSWIWAVTASGNVEGNQVSVTNSDDIIVSGMIQGSAGTFGSYTAGGNGSWDGFVAKLSQSGTWLWANGIGGSGYDGCSIGSVTPDGDILVAGKFSGTIQLGGTQLTSNGGADIYIGRMFTSNGTWKSITSVGGTGNDLLAGRNPVVHDKNGNSYFGGYFENTVSFGNHSITSAGSEDIFVARYNSNDTWGWAKRAGSSGSSDWLYGIQLENEVLTVTGHFSGTADFGSVNLSSSSGYDVFVAGLTSAGEWTWAVSASGSGDDVGRSMAPIGNGISAVTGAFESSLTFGNTSLTSSGNSDVFLAWIKTADTFHISSISPENGTTSGGTNVTLTGGGYDTLPQYRREITVANPYSEAVENLTFDVVDPIYNETGLIASYHLDETSGTIADSSGNDYYGTTYGNSVYGVEGKVGAAMEFDGTNNNRVELQQSLNPSSIALSAWVNPNSSQNQIIVGSSAGYYLALRANGTIEWHWWTSTSHYLYGSATVPTRVWSHITASYDATSGASTVYLDGQIYSQTSISPAALKNQSGKLGIGDCDSCSYSTFDGIIDEVRVYERALTSTEVSALSDGRSRLDYGDVCFWAADGSALDHEMLNDGHFRLLIPSMTAGETRTLNITYGAAGLDASSTAVDRYQTDADISFSSTPRVDMVNDENLTGWWRLDEKSGTTLYDYSGNGNHGTISGSPSMGEQGKVGTSMVFDGTSDFVSLGTSINSQHASSTNDFTTCSWFKTTSTTSFQGFNYIAGNVVDGSPWNGYHLGLNNSKPHMVAISAPNGHYPITGTSNVNDGKWHFICGGRDGGTVFLYTDGQLDGTTNIGSATLETPSTSWIGGSEGNTSPMRKFTGTIDEVRMHDRALTSTEISDYYNETVGPVAHWKLEENNPSSSGFIDSTGNGWDGQCYSSCPSRVTGMDGYGQSHSGGASGGGHGLNTSLILDGAKGATLSTWFKLSTLSGDGAFISSIYGSHSQIGLGYDNASTDVFKFTLEDVSGGIQSVNCDASACAPVTGDWHHLAVSLKSNSVEWYYDGQLVETDSVTFSELEPQLVNRIRIAGRFDQNINYYYSGSLDDVRVYDRGLSAEQVSDMYDSYSSGAHPILNLQMDEHAGILADASGNRNDGIPFNGPTLGVNGTVMKGVDFDGVDDHIIVGSSAIDAIIESGEMTASAWVRIDSSVSGNPHILSGGKGNSSFGSLIGLSVEANGTARFYTPSSTINYPEIWSTTTIDDDKWHHVTATLDATTISSTVIRIYIDGTLEATMSGFYWDSNQTSTTYLDELVIGTTNQPSPSSQYFLDGRLDEVRLYDHALTSSAISELRDDTSPPIAHWKLDETSGTIIDSSGNGYNGTASGGPTYGVEGALGTALDFDGSSDHIAISSPPDWYSGDSFTWLLWVKMDDVSSDQLFIQHGTASGTSGNGAYLNYYQNKVMFTSPLNSGQGVESPADTITQGKWTHLALVVDIYGNTSLFIDGVDVSQNAYNGDLTAISTPSGSMHIGEDAHRSVQNLDGGVDDVRIFGRALSTEEIKAFYQETTVLHPTAHWKLDDISGTIVDSSGNGHNGTASGGPTYGAEGVLGTALGFDGSNDYIDLNYYINTLPSGGMSYCMWAKNTLPTLTNAVAIWGTDGSHEWRIIIQTNGSIGTYIRGTGGSVGVAAGNLSVEVWHHICSVYDDDSSALNLYVDGSLVASTAVNLSGFNQGVDQFLGCMDQSGSCRSDYDKFKGVIDDVFLFEGALSASSILDYYQEVINSSVSPLGSVGTETSIPLSLTIGGASATNVTLVNDTTINATAPAAPGGIAGMANVTLTGWNGMSTTLVNGFEYLVPDLDGDGWDDDDDEFPNDYTQWNDTDSDGYGDNWEDGAWNASRNGTQGQWLLNATTPDGCPVTSGNSTLGGWWGCPDTDGDGWADLLDDFSNDSTQWNDTDGDGWGDNLSGNNPDQFINDSTQWNDTDGDGFGDNWGNASLNATRNGTVGSWVDNATLVDKFPTYESAANDADNDGHPDNWTFLATLTNGGSQDGLRLDACPLIWGNSTEDRNACLDSDWDGWSDPDANWTWAEGADNFTSNPTQWNDTDDDGYGDNWANGSWNSTRDVMGIGQWVENASSVDWCPDEWGNSTNQRLGCIDTDGDGLGDFDDAFPLDPLRGGDTDGDGFDDAIDDACPLDYGTSTIDRLGCPDADGDGYSDPDAEWTTANGSDAFPGDITQWADQDGDSFGDNPNGTTPDSCLDTAGNSSIDRYGCPDPDDDGYSNPDGNWTWVNGADNFTDDATQWADSDGDGYGDNWNNSPGQVGVGEYIENAITPDLCPLEWGNSTRDRFGCLDGDGDGQSDANDDLPDDPLRWIDGDGDGYDDLWEDNCTGQAGNSTAGNLFGCLDSDGDGWADQIDDFVNDSTQWSDSDGDGYGDNWNREDWNGTWNSTFFGIAQGIWVENATTPDRCPNEWGNSTKPPSLGCTDADGDGWPDYSDPEPEEWTWWSDIDQDGVIDMYDDCPETFGPSFIPEYNGCQWPNDSPPSPPSLSFSTPSGDSGITLNISWQSAERWDISHYALYTSTAEEPPDAIGGWSKVADISIENSAYQLTVMPNQETWIILLSVDYSGRTSFQESSSILGIPVDDSAPSPVSEMFSELVFEGSEARILIYWTGVADYDLDHYVIYVREANEELNTSWTAWNLTFPTAIVYSEQATNIRIIPDNAIPPIPREVELWVVILTVDKSGNVQYGDSVRGIVTLPAMSASDLGQTQDGGAEEFSPFEKIMGSDAPTIASRTVGFGAVLIAIIALIKSNLILQIVPDALRWGKLAKHRIKMSAETEKELTYLQSVVTAYHEEEEEMLNELDRIESDINSRFVNKEIKSDTKEVIISLINDLREMSYDKWARVAFDQTWFGFAEASTTIDRTSMLKEEAAFRETEDAVLDGVEDESERLFPPNSIASRDDTLKWLRGEISADSHSDIIKEQLKERGWNLAQVLWMIAEVER